MGFNNIAMQIAFFVEPHYCFDRDDVVYINTVSIWDVIGATKPRNP